MCRAGPAHNRAVRARSALAGVSWRFMTQATGLTLEINGRAATAGELRALALGVYGHFTAMQLRGGRTRGLQLHLDRLDAASREMFGAALEGGQVRDLIRHALGARVRDASVRVIVQQPAEQEPPWVTVTVRPPAGPLPDSSSSNLRIWNTGPRPPLGQERQAAVREPRPRSASVDDPHDVIPGLARPWSGGRSAPGAEGTGKGREPPADGNSDHPLASEGLSHPQRETTPRQPQPDRSTSDHRPPAPARRVADHADAIYVQRLKNLIVAGLARPQQK